MKSEKRLEEGYREMADDSEHEREAEEWCEALIGDSCEIADSSLRSEWQGLCDGRSAEKHAGLK